MDRIAQDQLEAVLREVIDKRCNSGDGRLNEKIKPQFVSCCAEELKAQIAFELQEWQLNPRGELHGGMIATMFDTAMGITAHTVAWLGGAASVTTTDLSVSYVRPLIPEDRLVVHVSLKNAGRRLIRVSADGFSEKTGKLAATSIATFMPLMPL